MYVPTRTLSVRTTLFIYDGVGWVVFSDFGLSRVAQLESITATAIKGHSVQSAYLQLHPMLRDNVIRVLGRGYGSDHSQK